MLTVSLGLILPRENLTDSSRRLLSVITPGIYSENSSGVAVGDEELAWFPNGPRHPRISRRLPIFSIVHVTHSSLFDISDHVFDTAVHFERLLLSQRSSIAVRTSMMYRALCMFQLGKVKLLLHKRVKPFTRSIPVLCRAKNIPRQHEFL